MQNYWQRRGNKSFETDSPLVLARVLTALDSNPWNREVRAAGELMCEQGFMDSEPYGTYGDAQTFSLTDAGREALARIDKFDIVGQIEQSPAMNARVAVWFAILTCGVHPDTYYTNLHFGHFGEAFHVLSCGVDAEASSEPEDTEWSTFTDTESPNDMHTGLSAKFTCQCGKVHDFEMALKGGVYSWLITFMTDPAGYFTSLK